MRLGKAVSRLFRLVTFWKDGNWLNYTGIEKTKSKYCLFGSDPVNDEIIIDLASLKNANSRHLVYEALDIQYNLRSKYQLKVKNYILLDRDLELLSEIFVKHSILLRDMIYLSNNQDCLDTYFGGAAKSILTIESSVQY
jgi:hypothetical protein